MKPRTKLQLEVVKLSSNLQNINNKMLSWAKIKCLDHKGYATKNKVHCLDCGNSFSPELVKNKKAVCPYCHAKLKVEQTKRRKDAQRLYIAIAEIHSRFQVIRNFEVTAYYRAGEKPRYYIHEILQHWLAPNGKREVMSRNHVQNWYCDSWSGGDMEIRDKNNTQRYDVYPYLIHPESKFLPALKRYGINYRLKGLTPLEAITIIPKDSKAETLLKAKQYEFLKCYSNWQGRDIDRYWPSIKICMRNHYKINDLSMWFDYLGLLNRFHKDLRNAHYVCPKDLKTAHDEYVDKRRKEEEREEKERQAKKLLKAKEYEQIYEKEKSKFFGVVITDGLIDIEVLRSVEEFKQEGDAMHHCVFACEYFKQKNSLILSARVKGKRVETVEVSLKRFEVVQFRAVCNGQSEYHQRIVDLVKKNMSLIKKAAA